jgi:hypothetical protein
MNSLNILLIYYSIIIIIIILYLIFLYSFYLRFPTGGKTMLVCVSACVRTCTHFPAQNSLTQSTGTRSVACRY